MGYFRYVYLLLAAVVTIAGLGMIADKDRSLQLQRLPLVVEDTHDQMKAIAGYLRDYEGSHGHYPTNDEGLLAVEPLVQACEMYRYSDKSIAHCRVRDSGILTRFGDPFIYENRRGIDRRRFWDSGATFDSKRMYSVRVDRDVYVWSIGAKQACDTLALWRPRLVLATCAVWFASTILLGLFLLESWRAARRKARPAERTSSGVRSALAGLALWGLTSLLMFPVLAKTCYEGSIYWPRRPRLDAECRSLLSKYRKRGIIQDATYAKIIKAMDERDDYRN